MSSPNVKDRLLPPLLYRLTDNNPHNQANVAPEPHFMSMKTYRETVIKDLERLFNETKLTSSRGLDLAPYPYVSKSVLNYGFADLIGRVLSGAQTEDLEDLVRETIECYEPRILRDSLKISVRIHEDREDQLALAFYIEGELWAEPTEHFAATTEADLADWRFTVSESENSGAGDG
jgi:type VI secretion system protein ImpF